MKKRNVLIFVLVYLFIGLQIIQAQSARKLTRNAEKEYEDGNREVALNLCTQALEKDSTYADAYFLRGKIFDNNENFDKALEDYQNAVLFDRSYTEAYIALGKIYNDMDKYKEAIKHLDKAISLDKSNTSALISIIYATVQTKDFNKALQHANALLDAEKSFYSYYVRGVINDSLNNYNDAETDYKMAISYDYEYAKSYYALAEMYIKNGNNEGALEYTNKIINLYPDETEGYWLRSEANRNLMNYDQAIADLSKINLLTPDREKVYYRRATYYKEYSQQQNAINDYSKVIAINPDNYEAYYYRAMLYDEVDNADNAIADYEHLVSTEVPDSIHTYAVERLYDLKREENKPELVMKEPEPVDKRILRIKDDQDFLKIKAEVVDQSDIEFVKVLDKALHFEKNDEGVTIVNDSVEVIGYEEIDVIVSDVYHNKNTFDFRIERLEVDPPEVNLITPYSSFDGEIYLSSNDPKLYIEGSISDESLIKSIYIDDVIASYRRDELNPTFSSTLDILNKNTFQIKVTDVNDNVSVTEYRLNREGINLSEDNPMGKTWVIFIENSNYESFASLEGPTKDVTTMKAALANYQIHNIIHKKDMTKMQLEKFFSIDLRDLVKENHVNSLLVWYAGHGKFINESGYWIPVNAVRDDEFTYFNINSLKASMQSYSKYITHVLIVTDACESGPSFYQAMRSTPEERSCDDVNATKFKSSQVFSSAGYELAVDNSQFTKTFAKSLTFNENACMPIESIVVKVTEAVEKNNKQKPKFGKIQGFEDENGTFFFIKKED